MAVVLLGANNTDDGTYTVINATPNWTDGGAVVCTVPGTISLMKMKMSQNNITQTGTMTTQLRAIGGVDIQGYGSFDMTTITKGAAPAWYTINLTDGVLVAVDELMYPRAQRDQSSGITPYWYKQGTVPYTVEVWGEELAAPTKATTPAPTNAASNVTLDQATLTWVDGGGADTYDVYYGDSAAAVAAADTTDKTGIYLGNQAELSLTVTGITSGSPYEYVVSRYWRIDSVNDAGTTTGDAWSFTTIDFDQIRVSYTLISEAEGGGVPGWTGYGPYDSTPGVEGIDFRYNGENNMITIRRLVAAANNKIWIEEI